MLSLRNGAEKDARDNTGGTPLMDAAYHGRLPSVKALLAAGAEMPTSPTSSGVPLSKELPRKGMMR